MQDVWRRPATGRSAWERSCLPRGSACTQEGPHRHFAVQPFAALGRLERAAQIFHLSIPLSIHPPLGWVIPKNGAGGAALGRGLWELCLCCWVLGCQALVSDLRGVTMA